VKAELRDQEAYSVGERGAEWAGRHGNHRRCNASTSDYHTG
jgi:hypothetical protein